MVLKRLLKKHRGQPRKIVTDKLRSYNVAHRELIPETIHDTTQYANNRAELSHEPTRVRERGMRKIKSMEQAQRFLGAHAAVHNLFNIGRHLLSAENYRYFRLRGLHAIAGIRDASLFGLFGAWHQPTSGHHWRFQCWQARWVPVLVI